jgi:hypothetical protein
MQNCGCPCETRYGCTVALESSAPHQQQQDEQEYRMAQLRSRCHVPNESLAVNAYQRERERKCVCVCVCESERVLLV